MIHIPASVRPALNRSILQLRKQAPHILFGVGVVGFGTTVVLSSRATLKLEATLDDVKFHVDEVKKMYEDGLDHPERGRDLAYVYGRGFAKLAKLYAPTVVVGVASIAALSGSHVIMTRRNAGLTAAVATLTKALEEYRTRVREELGEEKERELYHGIKFVEETIDGKKQMVAIKDGPLSGYARYFDEGSPHWNKDASYNRLYVLAQQQYANDLLHNRGHIFLNEVYDMLGIERSAEGQVVGWVMSEGQEFGDNFVDFGIYEVRNAGFRNGTEPRVLLDFNVNGVVYDLI